MDEIADQLQVRDRVMRRMQAQLTPEQRMARWEVLQAECFAALRASPEGYRRFMERNRRQRAVSVRDGLPATD